MDIQQEIEALKARNERVEADKAWETSNTRKCVLAVLTYFVALLFMWVIGVDKPFLSALVPTGGFMLSTLSLHGIKAWWLKRRA